MLGLAVTLCGVLGQAVAAPAALLTPDGPQWLGPLPPGGGGDVVVLDPRSGELYVEARDGDGPHRVWEHGAWRAGDTPILTGQEGAASIHYEWDTSAPDRLISVDAADGIRRRYFYDAQGRISGLLWADGSTLTVRYGDDGRVTALEGPGSSIWRVRWGDPVTVIDPWGRTTTLRWRKESATGLLGLEVQDALGHTTWTWYDGKKPVAWEDPRGLTTTVATHEGGLRVTDGAGRLWELELDAAERVTGLRSPGGDRWVWQRDGLGRVVSVTDPAGRMTRWDRDEAGRVEQVTQAGAEWRIHRDEQGRVSLIEDPSGARLELVRDSAGRVNRIIDPAGGELQLGFGLGRWPNSITERTGAKWSVSLDLLGRPGRLADPSGRTVRLERDSGGRLRWIRDSERGTTQLLWSGARLLTRAIDPSGAEVGFERDGAGRISGVRRGGDHVGFQRDPAGEVSAVSGSLGPSGEDYELAVRRDPAGLPVRVGDVRFTWDPSGQLTGVQGLGLDLALQRDGGGWLTAVRADALRIRVDRDPAGRPLRWTDDTGAVSLVRDASGRVREERGEITTRVERDARGLPNRVISGDLEWRFLRDPAGRPLRVSGPMDMEVGVDWDLAGRPALIRGAAGELARYVWEAGQPVSSFVSAAGQALEAAGLCEGRWAPDGEDAWIWAAESCALPEESRPWTLNSERIALVRDPYGVARRAVGAEGSVRLVWDALGRLTALAPEGGGEGWSFVYDPVGRVRSVGLPSGAEVPLTWAMVSEAWPEGPASLLLSTGREASRAWLQGPLGLLAAAEPGWSATVLPDGVGSPAWVLSSAGAPEPVYTTESGYPSSAVAGIAGARGALQPFPGGPLFMGERRGVLAGLGVIAVDPVSGRRLDGADRWPWASTGAGSRLDPSPWLPESSWGRPLEILLALGAISEVDDGPWVALPGPSPALGWLPASLDHSPTPLGPEPLGLPLDEDPLTSALILSLLPGQPPPDAALALRVALAEELEPLTLPPGVLPPSLAWLNKFQ